MVKLLLVIRSFCPYARVRLGEECRLLGSEERELRESELNYLGLSCSAPCTNDEEAIKDFKDITSEITYNLKCLLKLFNSCVQISYVKYSETETDLVPRDVLSSLMPDSPQPEDL